MDVQKDAADRMMKDSARSLSATPLYAHNNSRTDALHRPTISTEQQNVSNFSRLDDEASAVCERDKIAWQNLEVQLMQATNQDKKLSELCFQRAIEKKKRVCTLRYARKNTGSWGILALLLLGVVPASLFIFALACAIYSIKIVHPQ